MTTPTALPRVKRLSCFPDLPPPPSNLVQEVEPFEKQSLETSLAWAVKLRQHVNDGNWDQAGKLLVHQTDFKRDPEAAIRIVNYRESPEGLSTFQLMCLKGAKPSLIWIAFLRGADEAALGRPPKSSAEDKPIAETAAHLAARNRHWETLKELLLRGKSALLTNEQDETVLHLLYANPNGTIDHDLVQTVLRRGVDIDKKAANGESVLLRCLKAGNLSESEYLIEKGASIKSLGEGEKLALCSLIERRLPTLSMSRSQNKWEEVKTLIYWLEKNKQGLSDEGISEMLNYRRSDDQFTFMHAMAAFGAPVEIVEKAISLGANPRLYASVNTEQYGKIEHCNALHMALRNGFYRIAESFLKAGVDPNEPDSQLNTAMHCLYHIPHSPDKGRIPLMLRETGILTALLRHGADYKAKNAAGETFLSLAMCAKDSTAVYTLASELERIGKAPDSEVEAVGVVGDLCNRKKARRYLPEMSELLKQKQRLDHAMLYLGALIEAKKPVSDHTSSSLYKLLPDLLYTYKPGSAAELVRLIDRLLKRGDWKGYHPNESELLCLLGHPEAITNRKNHTDPIVAALKSIGGMVEFEDVDINERRVRCWERVGALAYAFRLWKYDCLPVLEDGSESKGKIAPKSLFEASALFSASSHHPSNEHFGARFTLVPGRHKLQCLRLQNGLSTIVPFNDDTYLEFRGAYMLISHKDHGTLLIRNATSSAANRVFRNTAYWSPNGIGKGFSTSDFWQFDLHLLEVHFRPLLSWEVNRREVSLDEHLEFLLDHVDAALYQGYFSLKFDTSRTAIQQEKVTDDLTLSVMHGGFNSPVFRHQVQQLEVLFENGKKYGSSVPDLAFMPARMPPFLELPFMGPEDKEQTRLHTTKEVIDALKMVVENNYSDDLLEASGLRNFWQQAGFDREGLLVMVDPLTH